MITSTSLREHTAKDLAKMAKTQGVQGWHSMRKEQLIRALLRLAKKRSAGWNGVRATARRSINAGSAASRPKRGPEPEHSNESSWAKASAARFQQLCMPNNLPKSLARKKRTKDRLVLMVRDAHWLHVYWELRRKSVERAAAALGPEWHTAKPVLRLYQITGDGTTNTVASVVRDIPIHGGADHWYVDIIDSPASFRVEIGYLAESGRFFALAKSNTVNTPTPGGSDEIDKNWDDVASDFDKIYAMSGGYQETGSCGDLKELFEERLRRPMGSPMVTRFGAAGLLPCGKEFHFEVEAELLIYGAATPGAHITVRGEPLQLREDGSFTIRAELPERRQVIPIVANSPDGVEQRTTVLALERNTKVMETLIRDPERPLE